MIEKVLPVLLTVVLLAMGISGAGSNEVAVIPAASASDEVIYTQIMDSIGPDLAARAQEAGFNLDISFTFYTGAGAADFTAIEVELRSAIGTAMYDNNTVDWELMRDIQCAIVDANVFGLSPEDMETAKNTYYTPDNHNADIDFSSGVNLHINESPFGYEALFYLRHNSSSLSSSYSYQWSASYGWDGITYDSRTSNP